MVEPTTDPSSLASEPVARWAAAIARLGAEVPGERLDALATIVATQLRTDPTDTPITPATHGDLPPVVREFVEQFVVDVGGITPDQRTAALGALGADAFVTVQALYVLDLGTRATIAFRHLFGPAFPIATDAPESLWTALEEFMRAVARLTALDPTTTELVRLRGARAHHCRLCQSLRNVEAARAGTDDAFFDQIDDYEHSSLSDRHRGALRLVDAMIWQPSAWPAELATQLHEHFSPAELVELVLDIMRNAANKIAVAFGADDAHVSDGVEYYDTDANGDLVYGLTL